ncbi:RagB/SusD family nutrient uptake outer membrane protein, partial [Arsenicibacter rosenii]
TRAAKPGKTAAMQIKADQVTLDFILDERARELAGEQIRWFDLKRTGKLIERIKAYAPDNAVNLQDYHTLRPIPQTQLDAVTNKTDFKQNPGYQ